MTFEDLDAEDFNENNKTFSNVYVYVLSVPMLNFVIFDLCIYCTLYGDDFEVKKQENSCFFMSADCFDIG